MWILRASRAQALCRPPEPACGVPLLDVVSRSDVAVRRRHLALSAALLAGVLAVHGVAGFGSQAHAATCGTVKLWDPMGYGPSQMLTPPVGLDSVKDISATAAWVWALKYDGTLVGWGSAKFDTDGGMTKGAAGLTGVASVSMGNSHVLALKKDGTVLAWGENTHGQTTVPASLKNGVQVAAGAAHSVVLTSDGKMHSWGLDAGWDYSKHTFVAIAASERSGTTAGLKADGSIEMWTHYGSTFSVNTAKAMPVGLKAIELALNRNFNVAIKPDHTIAVFSGGDSWGVVANAPKGLKDAVAAATAEPFAAVLRANGQVIAFGAQVKNPPKMDGATAIAVAGTYILGVVCSEGCGAISATGCCTGDTLTVCDGTNKLADTKCQAGTCGWDANKSGYGCGTPGKAAPDTQWPHKCTDWCKGDCKGKTCGDDGCGGSCGTCATGKVCENATGTCKCQPQCDGKSCGPDGCGGTCGVCPGNLACDLNTGKCPACTKDCVGDKCTPVGCISPCGVVAAGGKSDDRTEVPADLNRVSDIQITSSNGIALMHDGTLKAWGFKDHFGVPQGVQGKTGIKAIATGITHALALDKTGAVHAWGDSYRNKTKIPAGLKDVVAIAAGYHHSVALQADGTIAAWGSSYGGTDADGQTGFVAVAAGGYHTAGIKKDGGVVVWSDQSTLKAVPAGLVATSVSLGQYHALALRPDGTVVAWGKDWQDDGTLSVPAGLKDVVAVSVGDRASFALKHDGTVVGWGYNGFGQIKDAEKLKGVTSFRASPYVEFIAALTCADACGAVSHLGCCQGSSLSVCNAASAITKVSCASGTCG